MDDGWRMISNIKIEGHHLLSVQLPKTIVARLPKYSYQTVTGRRKVERQKVDKGMQESMSELAILQIP